MRIRFLLSLVLLASPAIAETIDNCASVLGSLAVELRVARSLPPGKSTTFRCPEATGPLLGASKQRIVNSLGAPDATGNAGGSVIEWSYFFASSADERGVAGVPQLTFSFDEQQLVSSVRCQRTR